MQLKSISNLNLSANDHISTCVCFAAHIIKSIYCREEVDDFSRDFVLVVYV